MINHIDFSQYARWIHCPWGWFEFYCNKRKKRWPLGQRDDALAIGSLVHSGLEGWYKNGVPEIAQAVIDRLSPTGDALRMCRSLVHGYVQVYPKEDWELLRCEEPVRFALIEGKDGLAKIDLYFYLDRPTVVESGIMGYEITLRPGWWIQEYKTKSPHVAIGEWMQAWVTNMQADFQMLALQYYLKGGQIGDNKPVGPWSNQVNGLLVNVIEKPKDYIPKRKCQKCEEYYAFSSWLPSGDGYACAVCGNVQKLKPIEMKPQAEGKYFRMVVERTPEQLAAAKQQISKVAGDMKFMEILPWDNSMVTTPFQFFAPNKTHCYDLSKRYGKECEYYRAHTNTIGLTTINDVEHYEEAEDYIGEIGTT